MEINNYAMNIIGTEEFLFVDLKTNEIRCLPALTKETESLLRIPTQDELYPYVQAVGDFILEKSLNIPRKTSARSFLIQNDLWSEFRDEFWNVESERRLEKWLNHIVSVA